MEARPPDTLPGRSRAGSTRRELLGAAGAALAHSLMRELVGPRFARAQEVPGLQIAFREPWADIVGLGDGIWGVVSKPLESQDWRTLANGGIVAGSERTLAIEGFLRTGGAEWVAERALELTGRRPTDVVVTHYHGDHVGGLAGYAAGHERPRVWMTRVTLDLVRRDDRERETGDPVRRAMLDEVEILETGTPTDLDLGGRRITIYPRMGHTASDLTLELDDPSLVFCGDLVWNGLFPNYRDTLPSELARSVRQTLRERETLYVPGHGALATAEDYRQFVDLIDSLETAARRAVEEGLALSEAAAAYRLPGPMSDWHLFRESYFETALGAWYRELQE